MTTIVFVLAVLVSIGNFATSVLLPSLPSMAKTMNVSTAAVSSAISVYLVAFALGQLLVGPLSDRYGRWKPVVFGLLIFIIGSAWCAAAADLPSLLTGRIVQGLGACSASVLSRAIARDLLSGERLTRALAFIMVAMSAAPGFSPLIGGLLDHAFGWRSGFIAVGVYAAIAVLSYIVLLGETHYADAGVSLRPATIAREYWTLASDIRFIIPASAAGCLMGAVFAMFAASPRVLIEGLGLTPIQVGLFFAGIVFVIFASGTLTPRLAFKIGHVRAAFVGLSITTLGGCTLLLANWIDHSLWGYLIPVAIFLCGFGIVTPLATSTTLQPFGSKAGLASALLGFLQMAGAAIGVMLTAAITSSAMLAVGAVQAVLTISALLLYIVGAGVTAAREKAVYLP